MIVVLLICLNMYFFFFFLRFYEGGKIFYKFYVKNLFSLFLKKN